MCGPVIFFPPPELGRALINHCHSMLYVAVPLSAQLAARAAGHGEADVQDQLIVKAYFLKTRALIKEARRRGLADLPSLSLEDLPSLIMVADDLIAAPGAYRDPELALQSARRAVELKSKDSEDAELAWHALGAAQYRAGDWKACIESLEGHTHAPQNGSFSLAMAYWQSGAKVRARACFSLADAWLREYERKWKGGKYPRPAILRLLRTEAEALLGVKSADAPENSVLVPGVGRPTDGVVAGTDQPVAGTGHNEFRFSKGRIRANPDGIWVMTLDGDITQYHFKVTRREAGMMQLEEVKKQHNSIMITKDKILCLQHPDDFVDELIYREIPGYEGSWTD
jgi:hypothetical protein